MDNQDRQVIDGLFGRLGSAEREAGPRDPQAEALIGQHLMRQPNAPYFMAQTLVMQDYALQSAQARIEELERQAAARPAGGGGFLSSLFGGGQPARGPDPRQQQRYGQPGMGQPGMGQQQGMVPPMQHPPQRGGFLAGAAQTAMGVAGGLLIGNMIAGMFTGGAAEAAPTDAAAAEPPPEDMGGGDEGGGFFDGMFGGDEEF